MDRQHLVLANVLRWNKLLLTTALTWLSILKELSKIIPRFLTECRMLGAREPKNWVERSGEGLPTNNDLGLALVKVEEVCTHPLLDVSQTIME